MPSIKYDIEFSLDDPRTTLRHREIILSKPFLKKIYEEWYAEFSDTLKSIPEGKVLEVGSGGGFLKDVMPQVITSDILQLPHCDFQLSAEELPFEDNSLSAIFMVNVFHHIPRPYLFLKEAQRTLKPGGRVVMIEPANTLFSRFVYKNFHHEPFDEKGAREIPAGNPLSLSNQALPYIYFERDKQKFRQEFPLLLIHEISYHTPFRYILSGGVSRKNLIPYFFYPIVRFKENLFSFLNRYTSLFCTITLVKK